MKRTRKQIGSLLLSVCMVFTMLPTVAFAEEGVQDSGTSLGTREITAFADLAEDVALQEVETGTTLEELNLPSTLTVIVTTVTTGSAMTATVSGDDVATDSEAQETETQEETTIEVSDWAADPDYDGETAGDYTFTPTLNLPEGITVAAGVTLPQIRVTVEAPVATMLSSSPILLGSSTYDYVIDLSGELDMGDADDTDGYSTFDEGTSITLNETGKSYCITGTTTDTFTDYYLATFDIASLTLDDAWIETNRGHALVLFENTMLTLIGTNSLTGTMNGISGFLTDLTIDGTGTLTTDKISYINSLTINSGTVNADLSANSVTVNGGTVNAGFDANSVTVNGGTVNAVTELDFGISVDAITITGGSVYAAGKYGATLYQPTNGSDSVYMTTICGMPANTAVTSLTAPAGYGFEGMKTDDDGKLYLWLPEGSQNVTFTVGAENVDKTVTVAANNDNLFAAVDVITDVDNATELQTALEVNTLSIINVTGDINLNSGSFISVGSNHTLVIPEGKTVTVTENTCINVGSNTLTINGGGTFVSSNKSTIALYGTNGTLNLDNITVELKNTYSSGITVKTVNVNNGATIVLDSSTARNLMNIDSGYICTVNAGAKIEIINFWDDGLYLNAGTLHLNGGTITVSKGQSYNRGINLHNSSTFKYTSGTLSGAEGSSIYLSQNAKVEGMNGRFSDRNTIFTVSGLTNVGAEDAIASADSLSEGQYYWDGTLFLKSVITIDIQPQNATVTQGEISGVLNVSGTTSNGKTVGYQWFYISSEGGYSPVDGATSSTFTIPADLTSGSYGYYCVLSADGCGDVESDTAAVTVNASGETPATYAVMVNNGTGDGDYAKNATVNISADTAPSGKRFKEWTVDSGDVTLANAQASSTTFTMPANAVEVTATYEDIPAGVTSVTDVTLNKNNLSLYSNTTPNTATLIATVVPASATDQSVTWQSSNTAVATVDASGNVKTVGKGTVDITVTTTDGGYTASCTVTVSTYTSKGGSSSRGSSANETTVTENQPNQPITAVAPITAIAGTNGTASASIPDKSISDAIAKAQTHSKAQGKTTNGVSVALNVTMPEGATALTATLSRNALNSLVSAGVTNLEINGSPVTVTFDKKALTEIQNESSGNINIVIATKTNLSETAKKMIGTRPVYNITVSYGNNSTVSGFGGGVATIAIPYTPANGEAIGGLYVVYVDENGNATRVDGSAYDVNSGCVIFNTPHFSMYGVGYTAPSAKFTDIGSHWAKESIDYVVGRRLLLGTTETTFAPDTAMTRGMLVTVLGRLAGVDVSGYTTSSFTDVKAGSTFLQYIEWVYQKGIIQGIGNNKFAPDRAITREEIAVIIANFAKATGYTLPVTREATTYSDASGIGSTYKTAVTAMQQAGIMMGGTNNKFNSKSNATRAEVSSMLGRYIKLTIDPDTAQGWTLNDAGQYLYYKDGKALTDTQTIDGVKYFFNADGTLKTGWVKDGDNWRYYSGNKALVGWSEIGINSNIKTYYFNKDGIMTSGKWLEIDGKWYYFYTDGSLAKSTKIDDYEVDEKGVRKTK